MEMFRVCSTVFFMIDGQMFSFSEVVMRENVSENICEALFKRILSALKVQSQTRFKWTKYKTNNNKSAVETNQNKQKA